MAMLNYQRVHLLFKGQSKMWRPNDRSTWTFLSRQDRLGLLMNRMPNHYSHLSESEECTKALKLCLYVYHHLPHDKAFIV